MKRLLIPLPVLAVLLALFLLSQPSRAFTEQPAVSLSLPENGLIQNTLWDVNSLGQPNPPWYNPAWTIRRHVTITNTGSTLTNYQVLVNLGSTFDFSNAQADGIDLRITAADGVTLLSYWIESWNGAAQRAWVWVKIPSLPVGNTVIYLYYGNPSATPVSNGKDTFEVYDGFETYPVGSTPTGDYSNPGEWARYPGNPVLNLGSAGTWDSAGTTFASVISDTTAGQYRMYYHGWGSISPCTSSCIGLATSPDGQTWTKYGSNPVMTPGPSAWDASGVRVPMVWKEGPTDYRMIYTGSGSGGLQVGYATSTDGISWTKYASNPVFNDPTWANGSTENWGVIKVGTEYLMWYSDMSAPRESGIATSTDLIHWTPHSPTPIFATSGVPTDYTYSQFCPYTFTYGGYYYVIVPSYTSVGDYSRYYLYRSSSPYFPTSDRHLVRVIHTVGASGQWDALDSDTPFLLTTDIQRNAFPRNQLWTYYAGASATGGTWREGLLIETNIAAALTDAALPGGTLAWSATGGVTVVDSPVRQGLRSLQLNDPSNNTSINIKGSFASTERGSLGAWMRRDNTSDGDYDIYLYENTTLAAVAGLGRNGRFHYWNRDVNNPPGGYPTGFHDTAVSWSINTWYLVTLDFNAATDRYDFVVYDQNLAEVVRQSGISFGNAVTSINAATLYTDSRFIGLGFADDYRLRQNASPAPTVQTGAAQQTVDLEISKTASADTAYLGDTLIYTLRITNTSILAASSVIVTDTLPAAVSLVSAVPSQGNCGTARPVVCSLGGVAGNGNANIVITVSATSVGLATNTASVDSTAVDLLWQNNTASAATTILANADLSVSQVDAPDPVFVGDPLTYTITVHNSGPSVASNVRLTDTLPGGLTFVSISTDQGTCPPGSPIVCTLGTIPAGGNVHIALHVNPTTNGIFTNIVTVRSDINDRIPENNTSSEPTTILPSADLAVSQVDTPDPVGAGQPLTYTINVHNGGPSSSGSVTLTDNLPAVVDFVSADPAAYCSQASPVVCTLPGLPAGGDSQVRVVVLTTQEGLLTNTVTVSSSTFDRNLANNTSLENTVVATAVNLSVTQVDTPDPVLVEQPLTYQLTVHNAGPSIAAAVRLTDTLPGNVILQSVTPDSGSCSEGSTIVCTLGNLASGADAHVVVVVIPQAAGTVTNKVQVSTLTYEANLADNISQVDTTVLPLSADLALSLNGAPNPVAAGALLTYTAHVTNLGPSRAINPSVIVDLSNKVGLVSSTPICTQHAGSVTCPLVDLDSGGSADVVLTVRVSSSTFVSQISSQANVTSSVADPAPGNNHAVAITNLYREADLSIALYAEPNPVAPKTYLTYTLVFKNNGPSNAINLILTDTLPADVDYIDGSSSPECNAVPATHFVTCSPSDLEAGKSSQIVLVVKVKEVAVLPLVNKVEIASETPDPDLNNNSAEITTSLDVEPPTLQWLAPERNDSTSYYVPIMYPGLEITLTVRVTDNVQVDHIRFTRWDHVRNFYVEIGTGVEISPGVYQYVWVFTSAFELVPGQNAVYAYAYDTAGNWTRARIWVWPYPYPLVLPSVMKK